MTSSQRQPSSIAAISVEPLPPARAALARAIDCFDRARERLEEAQRVLTGMESVRVPVSGREASELRAQMGRLCEITNWLNASAEGARPSLPAELDRAEQWLSEVAGAAATAAERLSRYAYAPMDVRTVPAFCRASQDRELIGGVVLAGRTPIFPLSRPCPT
jgi:hypothetical protein